MDSQCSDEIDDEEVARKQTEEERIRREALAIKCTEFEEVEINSFDGVDGGYDDPTVVGENLEEH